MNFNILSERILPFIPYLSEKPTNVFVSFVVVFATAVEERRRTAVREDEAI